MKRLTTRNSMGVAVFKEFYNCENCNESIWRLPDYGNGSPTERLARYEELEEQCIGECGCNLNMVVLKYKEFLQHMHELAEFWKLEEQGLLWRLPCKVGDTVWCAIEDSRYLYGGVYEATVAGIEWSSGIGVKIVVRFKEDKQPISIVSFAEFEFGKSVFFGDAAKEEAEQALEERKKN